MHRSGSTSRASDEFFVSMSPQIKGSPGFKAVEIDQLPTYNPLSDIGKKETSRLRSAESAVHIIPMVLIVCAVILWFFSRPVDLGNKGDSVVASVTGLKTDRYGNQTASPLAIRKDDSHPLERLVDDDAERSSEKKSN
ncbi:uncharacterized protein LOC131223247 isoform X2 [Magnolia sinica]|uniref:uncharacterized protein LOC131223247 isoform X2 n=1 Tax=Magnolia sinica TaxID=86752 RepID=UPI00265B2B05|nr:uncharacterized protein LOC131223247 isoform X2 [Magnolia sinica]